MLKTFSSYFRTINQIKFPGFLGTNILKVTKSFIFKTDYKILSLYASAMAYSFFFSIFPAAILFFSLLPSLNLQHTENQINKLIAETLPPQTSELFKETIHGLFTEGGILTPLINLSMLLFFASRGVQTMLDAMSSIRKLNQDSYYIKDFLFSLLILIIVSVLIIAHTIIVVAGEYIFKQISIHFSAFTVAEAILFHSFNLLAGFLVICVSISIIYAVRPLGKKYWLWVSPGATLASAFILISQYFMRFYFQNFSNYNKLYGSIGAVMALMLWFYVVSFVFLAGYTYNTNIIKFKKILDR